MDGFEWKNDINHSRRFRFVKRMPNLFFFYFSRSILIGKLKFLYLIFESIISYQRSKSSNVWYVYHRKSFLINNNNNHNN